ncbi:MAG: hypothetical protein ABL308_04890 [Oceanicaulis sp.]
MKRLTALAGLTASWIAAAPAISAQPDDPATSGWLSGVETSTEIDLDILFALGEGDAPHDGPYADLRARFEAEKVADATLRYGVRLAGGAVRHDGGRGPGGYVECGPGCPDAVGLATGLHTAAALGPDEARAGLTRAEAYVKSGYFEIIGGLGETAAQAGRIAPSGVFRLAGADAALVSPAGSGHPDTALSLSAPTVRVMARSRRLAGFRASVSWAPEADPCGLDQCRPAAPLFGRPSLDGLWSAGVDFDHQFRSSGVRWSASAGVERADASASSPLYADPWLVSAGVSREEGGVTVSARWLASNDGLSSGRYEAASLAATYERGDWLYGVSAANARSDAFDVSETSILFGASRLIGRNGLAGAGVQISSETRPGAPGRDEDAALLAELGWRF